MGGGLAPAVTVLGRGGGVVEVVEAIVLLLPIVLWLHGDFALGVWGVVVNVVATIVCGVHLVSPLMVGGPHGSHVRGGGGEGGALLGGGSGSVGAGRRGNNVVVATRDRVLADVVRGHVLEGSRRVQVHLSDLLEFPATAAQGVVVYYVFVVGRQRFLIVGLRVGYIGELRVYRLRVIVHPILT